MNREDSQQIMIGQYQTQLDSFVEFNKDWMRGFMVYHTPQNAEKTPELLKLLNQLEQQCRHLDDYLNSYHAQQ